MKYRQITINLEVTIKLKYAQSTKRLPWKAHLLCGNNFISNNTQFELAGKEKKDN